tara:strand:- start:1359 stop:1601 length:243 start_codon:yes stop_codon:yes gene_type:complete
VNDPIERIVADGLTSADIEFVVDGEDDRCKGLDFYLPAHDVHIEVKQFHTDRVSEQMARAENVIVIQGKRAAETFAALLT